MKRKTLLFLMLMALFAPLAMNGQQTNTLLTEGFESSTLSTTYQATAWYSYNAGSGNNWLFGQMGQHTGSNCAYYAYDSSNPANCYMVSMPFSVNANMTQLSVSLYQKVASSSYPETFEVFFVKADDVTTQAAVASATHYSAIASASYTNTNWTERTGYNTNSALAGHWVRVVVHCTSDADMYRLHIDDLTVTETTSGPSYITEINNDTDWNNFAQSVRNGLDYSGKTVTLKADISITSQSNQAGSDGNLFKGTFDGNGHTITVNMTATGANCAPFFGVQDATIKNLIVTGSITSAYIQVGGLCAIANGNTTFNNCLSSVAITSTCTTTQGDANGWSTCGGFVGASGGGDNPTFVGCAFTGSLTASRNGCGGFIGFHFSRSGWSGNYDGRSTYTNCLCAPSSINITASESAVFSCGYNGGQYLYITAETGYYNEEGANLNTKQGTRVYSVTGQSPVTVAMSGTANPTYNVSGISVYSPGITLGSTIYGGENDQLSLTLNGSSSGYQASAGSLSDSGNPYTLTMTTSNSVISAIQTQPATLPYTENFENGQNGWEFGNGTQTNYWMVGSNTSYSSSNSLYITNDGTANAYSNTTSYVYAYRKLDIPSAGDYVVSFKWKANGESDYDLLRAFMIPASVNPTLTGGTNNGQSSYTNTTPTGWIDVANPSGQLNLQTTWQSSDKAVNLSTAGEYYLVFFWKNDASGGSTPPAAVDDIDIHAAVQYTITASANPSAGGTVSGAGTISESNTCTLVATPNNGYKFVNWTENGSEVSDNASYSFTVSGNRTLVANFEELGMFITSTPASTECLTAGTEVVLTARTNAIPQSLGEYAFTTGTDASKWYNVTSTTNIMDGTTSGDYAVSTVHTFADGFTFPFAGTKYTQFSVNADGNLRLGGTVTGTNNYSTPFSSSNANLNNPKINGMGFDGYFDVSTYGNYVHAQIFGEAPNRVLVVEFKESPYSSGYRQYTWNWQVQLSEDGTIQIVYGDTAPGSYYYSNQIGLCINASDGWTVSTSTHEATHFTNGTSTTNAAANSWPGVNRYYRFSPVLYEWTYTGTPGTANGDTYTVTLTQNSTYTASATVNGQTYNKTVSVTMAPAAPENLAASNITTTTATVSWTGSASSYEYSYDGGTTWTSTNNTSVDLTGLTPGQTYTFQVKAISGSCESTPASVDFTTPSTYNITATAYDDNNNTTGGGTISGTGSFNIGSTCELEATPDAGYEFVNWTENGTPVSTSATYSFTVSAARDLVAHFSLVEYTLTLTADPDGGGTVSASPSGPYHYNDVVTVTAIPSSGYIFGSWSDGGTAQHTVTITGNTTLTAYFGADQTLTTYANPIEGGYVTITENQVSTIGAVEVGDGTEHNVYTPFGTANAYSFAECIYLASEIQGAGTITSISYNCANVSTTQSNHIEVYMMNLDKASFANRRDFVAVTANDKVFDGTWTVSSEGWNTIILDKPFQYNGTDNLLIGIHENTPGTSALSFRFTSVANSSVLCFDNSKDMDPTNLDDLKNGHGMPELHAERANVRLGFGTYHYGQSVTLTAHANDGYQFVNWTENSNELGTNDTYTVTMDANHTIYANFERLAKRFVYAGDWNVDNNWRPTGAPDITDDVFIEAAATIPNGCVATANEITIDGGSITIEDGGQLQHNNAASSMVTVTVQNTIEGYTSADANTNKGYELLSFPVDNLTVNSSAITGLVTSDPYDFYRFDASADPLEWIPMTGSNSISLLQGFIYASQEGTTISVTGPVMSSATPVNSASVAYVTANAPRFNGWALLGNPFVCNAYVSANNDGEVNFYKLNHTSEYDEFIPFTNGDAINPMGGVMFQVDADNAITYSRTQSSGAKTGILNMDVTCVKDRATVTLDRARVRFGEGRNLEKLQFDTRHTKVYIPEGGNDFSVYYADGAGTIPVNFKAQDNGRYTLDFSTEDVGFNYLHLIDNMNGNDVDLLQTPYYAFDAKSTDFASRFTLVFATGSSTGSDTFAFFNNGVWIINNPSTGSGAEATLQVVDVLGHILSSETISGSCSKAINVAPGVYMLRLINGDKAKVQKVVVKR